MRTIPVSTVGQVSTEAAARARSAFAECYTLADVLAWARDQTPQREVTNIVTQDEYTHDVIVPFDGAHFVVFDST